MGVESFLLHSLNYLLENPVDECNVNIVQQIKITLDQNIDMLSFNSSLGIKLLEFIAKYKDIKNINILFDLIDMYKNYDETAFNNKLFEVSNATQSLVRELLLSNIKIGKNKSIVIDVDKEIRPASRGRSSCGNRNNTSLNSTMNKTNNTFASNTTHEVNVLKFDDEKDEGEGFTDNSIQLISRKLSISELRKLNQESNEEFTPLSTTNSINKQAFEFGDKENDKKKKLPPMAPNKRKNKLEPLRSVKVENQDEIDIFKSQDAFELSFSDTYNKKSLEKNLMKINFEEPDSLDFFK